MLHAMIMAGGGGTRFWPRSRQQRPKQFLTLGGDRTLLQQALDRIEALVAAGADLGHHGCGVQRRDRQAVAAVADRASSASRAAATRRRASAWARP